MRRLCGRAAPLALPAARDARVRPGFNLSILECGSRLTCLAAEVVTGSREEWEVKRACWVVYRIEMESVPRAHGVLTFYNFLHINTARLMAGHLPWHLRGTLGSRGCWLLHKVTLRIAQSSPSMNVHVRHVNSPYTKEHRPSINVSQNVLLRIRSKIS